jgi:preprotein translocase subunit SecF
MGAANSSGGVMGKMIDAQSIVVASTATRWFDHEGDILRYVFSLLGKEVDLLIVTALLTIAGYSINDTIIIFDRMRENLRIKRGVSFGEIVNSSVNETLSRTFITVLTVQIVCVVLYFFGGPVLRNFSLALVIGNLLGTYSSIAAATGLIYEWEVRISGRKAAEVQPVQIKGKKNRPNA